MVDFEISTTLIYNKRWGGGITLFNPLQNAEDKKKKFLEIFVG